jgi:anti-sigma B factor antagonist
VQFTETIEEEILVVKVLAPSLDAKSAPGMKRHLAKIIKQGHQHLVIDLSQVDFIDSSGLSVLASALKRLGKNGYLAISAPRDTVVSMLRLTRLYQVFNIFPERMQAIDAARASREVRPAPEGSEAGGR